MSADKWTEHEAVVRAMEVCGGFDGLLFRLEKQCDLNADASVADEVAFVYWSYAAHGLSVLRDGLPRFPK